MATRTSTQLQTMTPNATCAATQALNWRQVTMVARRAWTRPGRGAGTHDDHRLVEDGVGRRRRVALVDDFHHFLFDLDIIFGLSKYEGARYRRVQVHGRLGNAKIQRESQFRRRGPPTNCCRPDSRSPPARRAARRQPNNSRQTRSMMTCRRRTARSLAFRAAAAMARSTFLRRLWVPLAHNCRR